ncbi:MAG: enoyl-CoA hydratase/isomerase family protein [Coxiellaceae bacterium]|nr:enoyl-CoA hydratase/isomerase family protein [Coxiellaceae bacterium]
MQVDKAALLHIEDAIELTELENGIGLLRFLSKANCASLKVLQSIQQALKLAEKQLKALVIWQPSEKFFCVGADLPHICKLAEADDVDGMREYLNCFQQTSVAIRYAQLPVVAAVRGFALGGGCEIAMHCDAIVGHEELKIGLVESLIGLLPAGGGCKEMVYRASQAEDYLETLKQYFYQVAEGLRANSAEQAKQYNYMHANDPVVVDSDEVLEQAKAFALALTDNYQAQAPIEIPVVGEQYMADLLDYYHNHTEKQLTEHDELVVEQIAKVFCGMGADGTVTEQDFLKIELDAFMHLALTEKSRERIFHTLETGKPLQN